MQESLSYTEENYLKSIYNLCQNSTTLETSTNLIADYLKLKPATVTAMLKKLKEKKWINYERYGKVNLSSLGNGIALQIIRKHRLWEVFLVDKLKFTWDEVHEVAEQLEHIQSVKLINQLDAFLDFPKLDPHGDPIPNENGEMMQITKLFLSEAFEGKMYEVNAVNDSSSEFLQHLMQLKIALGSKLKVMKRMSYDNSLILLIDNTHEITVSEKFAQNILIQ